MQHVQPQQDQLTASLYKITANLIVQQKKTPQQAKDTLVKQGIGPEIAGVVVTNFMREYGTIRKNQGRKNMIYGGLWFVGGIVVTAATLSAARNGGTYVVAYGAIVFGAVQFITGLVAYNKA